MSGETTDAVEYVDVTLCESRDTPECGSYPSVVSMGQCVMCGAIVGNTDVHTAWHKAGEV